MKTQKGFTVPKKSVGLIFISRHESYKMKVVMQHHAVWHLMIALSTQVQIKLAIGLYRLQKSYSFKSTLKL